MTPKKKAKRTRSAYERIRDEIEKSKKRISDERYKLRDLIDDAEAICENCDESLESLEQAVDFLSQHL